MQVFMEGKWIPLQMPKIDKNTFDLIMHWSDNMNSYDLYIGINKDETKIIKEFLYETV